ncbi:SDR family oxidoreductase [Roseibium sp.]|uniref:SDR family oxidoreductase n=1 Tax=Roseibium sp. TaxID=1936156 RepID=UPI003B51EE3F
MDVFVTGGTGGIGSAVVRHLIEDGCQVIGLARSGSSSEKLRALGASAYPGDLRQPETWVDRAATCDAVIHTGATFSDDMGKVDRIAMLDLKKAARHRKQPLKIIYTGGIWLFPQTSDSGDLLSEKTPFAPLPAFRFMTETIKTLSAGTDVSLSVIHPALVCGPDFGPIAEMTAALKSGGKFETRANGQTLWPLVEVTDLARLYGLVLKQNRFRMSVIGSGISEISVDHLAAHISARHGKPLDIIPQQAPDGQNPDLDWAAGYALSQSVNNTHARRILGWTPEHATIEDLVVTLSK